MWICKKCRKNNNDVYCTDSDNNEIKVNEKMIDCSSNYELLNFVQGQWRDYCNTNSDKCICLDLNDKNDIDIYIKNIKKWIDNMTPGQLETWKIFLIDKLKDIIKKI